MPRAPQTADEAIEMGGEPPATEGPADLSTPQRGPAAGAASPTREVVNTSARDHLVVRRIHFKDVATGALTSPGILSINAHHLRFKGGPTADGDGPRTVAPLHRIHSAMKKGGGLGMGILFPYYIELVVWTGVEGQAAQNVCHLMFGDNEETLDRTMEVLQELMQAAKTQRVAEHGEMHPATPADIPSTPVVAPQEELEIRAAAQPTSVDFRDYRELQPGLVVYKVDTAFSDGRIGRTEYRYNQFAELNKQVCKLVPHIATQIDFPGKTWILGVHVLERKLALQKWSNHLLQEYHHERDRLESMQPSSDMDSARSYSTPSRREQPYQPRFTAEAWQHVLEFFSPEQMALREPGGDTVDEPQGELEAFEKILPFLRSPFDHVTIEYLLRAGGGPLRQGWLYKEGRDLKHAWKRRYFVLWPKTAHPKLGRILAYFTTNDAAGRCKGVVHLLKPVVRAPKTPRARYYCIRLNANGVRNVSAGRNSARLELVTDPKKYILGATGEMDIQDWVRDFRACGAPDELPDADPGVEGWMFKQGTGIIKWWSRCWVQLHASQLVHFDSSGLLPKGKFCVKDYEVYCPDSHKRQREFEIALLPKPQRFGHEMERNVSDAELPPRLAQFFFAERIDGFEKWRTALLQETQELQGLSGEEMYDQHRSGAARQMRTHARPPAELVSQDDTVERVSGQGQTGLDDFDLIRMLGMGAYGKVLLVRHRRNNKEYAMKVMEKQKIVKERQHKQIGQELKLMVEMIKQSQHPFIVQIHWAFQIPTRLFLVVDFMPGGELYHHLKKQRRFSETQVRFIAAELSLALAFLHEKDIAYRDLKPENVMFDEEGHVRLIDFGLAKAQVSKTVHLRATAVGTPLYMTPEGVRNYQAQMVEMDRRGGASMTPVRIEEHEQVSVDADWYTLGTLMFELSTGHAPFEDPNQNTLLQKIKDLPVPALDLSSRGLSVACQECILALLEKNPSKRLGHRGHQDIRTHAFYAELDWQKLQDKELDPPFRPNARAADNIDQQFQKANIRQVATGDPSGFYSAPAAGQGTEYFPDWHYSRDFSGDEASKAAARQAMAAPSALATTIEEGVPPLEPEPEPEYPEPEPEPPPS